MKPNKLLVITLAALLSATVLAVFVPPASAATTRALTITSSSANPTVPFQTFDGNPPKVFDFNGDGKLEIIAQNDNQYVYIFDSQTGKILAELTTELPSGWGARSFNGPEAAILTDGGTPRLVVVNSAGRLTMFRYDAAASSGTNFVFAKEWTSRPTICYSNPGSDSKPTFADLDKDGRLEIIMTHEERGVFAFRNNGDPYWHNCLGGGNAEVTIGDINQDGWPDVVHVSDGGVVAALNGRTGGWMWGLNLLTKLNLGSGSIPVGAAVGQLDGSGGLEIAVGARDSHDPDNWANDHAALVVISSTGQILWSRQHAQGTPLTYTHPIIVDADNDGQAELYWGDWNTVGHKPPWPGDATPAWKPQGVAAAYRYDPWGGLVWRTELHSWWHNKDFAIADVDGDGVQELLANGPNSAGQDGIWYLDVRTGARETHVSTHPFTVMRGAVVADLWNTRTTQFVVEVGGGGGHGILVFDTHVAYNAKWPHLPYESRSRSTNPTPTTTTTTTSQSPGGKFAATFTIKAPNEWWQELYVQPDTARTITSAQVRINDGAWKPMSKSSWGAWTSSYNAKAGAKVEFLAADSGGATSQSQPFTWLDGTLTKRSVGDSSPSPTPTSSSTSPTPTSTSASPTPTEEPGGTFGATFTIKSPNAWWQELYVQPDTARTISLAQVRINGGGWQTMTLRSWGAWASSYHSPSGSQVEFRVADSGGATSQSQPFTWLDGTLSKRSTTDGDGGGGFTATFTPKAVGNDWWVEVEVASASSITSVHVSLNGGAWTALELKSWGAWAKSLYAPNGTQVQFRATNSAGQTVTSGTYTWT